VQTLLALPDSNISLCVEVSRYLFLLGVSKEFACISLCFLFDWRSMCSYYVCWMLHPLSCNENLSNLINFFLFFPPTTFDIALYMNLIIHEKTNDLSSLMLLKCNLLAIFFSQKSSEKKYMLLKSNFSFVSTRKFFTFCLAYFLCHSYPRCKNIYI
jgi:hypothetical protein